MAKKPNPVANYLSAKACFDSGRRAHGPTGEPLSRECKAQENLMLSRGNEAASECETNAIEIDDCYASKKKGGRKEDCLAALLRCPEFKVPPPRAAKKTPPPLVAKKAAGKSETNWLLWGGVAVVAGFFLLRKK